MRLPPTPYDGSSRPFAIGIRPLEPGDWILGDDRLVRELALKDELIAARRDDVFRAEPGTEDAQREVFERLAAHLVEHRPEIYRRSGDAIEIVPAVRIIRLDHDAPPLLAASRLVQDDLVLMRRGEDGWRLAAASLCFPSSWSLAEKFGRPLDDIHAPVPGFGAGTRPAALIARMFDALRPEAPVRRENWSLQADDALPKPRDESGRTTRAIKALRRFADDAMVFVRVERQTLTKLPVSGDILFTIRIHVDPLEALAAHPRRNDVLLTFADQLQSLDADQLAYKGLAADREALAARIRALAAG